MPSHSTDTSGAAKARVGRLVRWGVAAVAMAFVAWQLAGEPELFQRLLAVRWQVLLGLCALTVLNQLLMSQRFSLAVAHCSGKRVPASAWFRLISIGQMLNLFVPQLGNVYRGVALKREHGVAYQAYASGLFAFVWLDLIMGFLIALLTISMIDPRLRFGAIPALPLLAAVVVVLAAVPSVLVRLLSSVRLRRGLIERAQTRVQTLLSTASSLLKKAPLMLRYFALNLLVTAGQVATLWLGFHSVGATLGLPSLLLFQVFLKLSNQVVLTPGNLGITELLFGALAYGSECTLQQGLAVSLLLRAAGTVAVVLLGVFAGGGPLLLRGRRSLMLGKGPC